MAITARVRNFTGPIATFHHTTTVEGMHVWIPGQDSFTPPKSIPSIDPFSTGTSQLWPLGTRLAWGERVFRYAKLGGTAVTEGKVVQGEAPITNYLNQAQTTGPAAAVGDTTFVFDHGATAEVANYFAEGYLLINDVTGEGQALRVKSHPAFAADTVAVTVTLYDPIVKATAISSNTDATLLINPYKNLIVSPATTLTAHPVGVTPSDVAANEYFWVQVAGPCAVLAVGTLVVGANAVVPTGTAGGAGPATAATETLIGRIMYAAATTDYALVFLKME